jgi:hypothetical protein
MFRSVSKLLAGCGPSEERKRTIPVMEFPARNGDMLHNKRRKSKGENHLHYQDFNCKKRCKETLSFSICHLPFFICHSCGIMSAMAIDKWKNGKWKMIKKEGRPRRPSL